jgi:hypothetical protein
MPRPMLGRQLLQAARCEGSNSRERLIQRCAQAVDVAANVASQGRRQQLRRQVADASHQRPVDRAGRLVQASGKAQVEQSRVTLG